MESDANSFQDIVDLRKAGWMSKDGDKGPKTIVEIREAVSNHQYDI